MMRFQLLLFLVLYAYLSFSYGQNNFIISSEALHQKLKEHEDTITSVAELSKKLSSDSFVFNESNSSGLLNGISNNWVLRSKKDYELRDKEVVMTYKGSFYLIRKNTDEELYVNLILTYPQSLQGLTLASFSYKSLKTEQVYPSSPPNFGNVLFSKESKVVYVNDSVLKYYGGVLVDKNESAIYAPIPIKNGTDQWVCNNDVKQEQISIKLPSKPGYYVLFETGIETSGINFRSCDLSSEPLFQELGLSLDDLEEETINDSISYFIGNEKDLKPLSYGYYDEIINLSFTHSVNQNEFKALSIKQLKNAEIICPEKIAYKIVDYKGDLFLAAYVSSEHNTSTAEAFYQRMLYQDSLFRKVQAIKSLYKSFPKDDLNSDERQKLITLLLKTNRDTLPVKFTNLPPKHLTDEMDYYTF